jgi:hypothetical protein
VYLSCDRDASSTIANMPAAAKVVAYWSTRRSCTDTDPALPLPSLIENCPKTNTASTTSGHMLSVSFSVQKHETNTIPDLIENCRL